MSEYSHNHGWKTSTIDVGRGLYCLHYVSGSGGVPPTVLVEASADSSGAVQIVWNPEYRRQELSRPGQYAVVSAARASRLIVTARAGTQNGSLQAHLELRPIDQLLQVHKAPEGGQHESLRTELVDRDGEARAPNQFRPYDDPESATGLSVLGHVARLGDVTAAPGDWIAGPSSPAPIEGLLLDMKPNAEGWIEYQVLVGGDQNWTPWVVGNQFAGTKGRALALTGIRLRISQTAPRELDLEASALFLGSPVISRNGDFIELRSASGRDPPIGFSLKLGKTMRELSPSFNYRAAREKYASATQRPDLEPEPVRGRVRVFRAGAERASV